MEHAVVIGGSMTGLLCARVLADHSDRVTIVERDSYPDAIENRRGVPQGRHTHGLLASGREVLERLFPGISGELIAAGAGRGDIARDFRWFFAGGCLKRSVSGMEALLMSRPFVETAVRKKVLGLSRVQVREDSAVEGLAFNPAAGRVTGIRIGGEILAADLVVDATGRGSHSPQWLEGIGYGRPLEERVEVALAYTTRSFRRSAKDMNGDVGAVIPSTPEGKRGGVMLAQEDNRWTVTLIGYFGNAAPTEIDGFIAYARTLPAPYIYEVIRDAEPLGDAAASRFPASVRRRYEKMQRFPEGYLVIGDAVSSFNPIYGQGMSAAALQAVALAEVLKAGPDNLARSFFDRVAKIVDGPWSIAVGNDLRMKETEGPRNVGVTVINWYLSKLHKAAHYDAVPALAFHRVGNLLEPPPSVLNPRVAFRVLMGNLRPRAGAPDANRDMQMAAGK